MSPKNRAENSAAELERAEEALREAERLLESGLRRGAISRAYYAAFHAARGFLYLADEQPKTHASLAARFRAVWAEGGRLPVDVADDLDDLAEKRGLVDYAVGYDPGEAAADLVRRARRFVERVAAEAKAKAE